MTGGNGPGASRRSLAVGVLGNALEWYDWNAYAVFATVLAGVLFDPADRVSALLSVFAVFAVGFVTRPLGGVLFGVIADRAGRRVVLIATMSLTAGSSLLVGLLPGYDRIGVWASVLLLAARLVQGLGHGGESSVAYAYVAEIAPPARRGYWSSSVFLSVSVGTLLATGLGAVLTATLTPAELAAWGWRVPFLVGGLLGFVALWMRRRASESGVFAASPRTPAGWPRGRLVVAGLRIGVLSAGIGVMYYAWIVFGVGTAVERHGMAPGAAFAAGFCAQMLMLVTLPLWGRLSDRVGRRPVILCYAQGALVLAFPITRIVSGQAWTLFVSEAVAMLLWAAVAAVYPAFVSELLPTAARGRVIGIAGSLANAVFGGTAPYLDELLTGHGLSWVFTAYIMVLCGLAVLCVWTAPETRGLDLSDLDGPALTVPQRGPRQGPERVPATGGAGTGGTPTAPAATARRAP